MYQIYGQRHMTARFWGIVAEVQTPEQAAYLFHFLWAHDHHRLELWKNGVPSKTATVEAYKMAAAQNPKLYFLNGEHMAAQIWKTNREHCHQYTTVADLK